MSSPETLSGERPRRQYRFGDFTLDLESGFLRRKGEEAALRPKAFEVLVYLTERHGRVVSREELLEAVWGDVAVTDESVTKCIADVRKALGDDSQRLIRTVARRGYVFTAPVTTPVAEFPSRLINADAESRPLPVAPSPPHRRFPDRLLMTVALVLLAIVAGGILLVRLMRRARQDLTYAQITNFTDSAVSPALSPDGRMLAFIRSDNWFLTPDQVYVKLLPSGEPVQITHDPRPKYGLTFSPDGSRIAYTVFDSSWSTFTVSPLGGEPRELLSNAAGLTWLSEHQVLFSETGGGVHMGVVTATENRSEYRKIYFPRDERGMAHLSSASPDRKWALVVEMNPAWQPCRVVPWDGSSAGRQVGPSGKCTSAAWSPDGKWMYFGVEIEGNHHLWRQQFPAGEPEQITSGLTEEDGIAVAPDGRSLVTSIGLGQSVLWIHDAHGDRQLSSEGRVLSPRTSRVAGTIPIISRDGKSLFYLRSESPGAPVELWRADLGSEKSEAVLRGVSILEYDISSDGKEVVFSTQPPGKPLQLWLAGLDLNSPPRLVSSSGEDSPRFGPEGEIFCRMSDGKAHYLARMKRDGSGRSKVVPYPIGSVGYISPDRHWITTISDGLNGSIGGTFAVPLTGGAPRRICSGCPVMWAPDGRFLYVGVQSESRAAAGKTLAIPVPPGETLPKLPISAAQGPSDLQTVAGSRPIDGFYISPGPEPSTFADVKTTMHRNLYRIPLRNQ